MQNIISKIENFDPKLYTKEQIQLLEKKGYSLDIDSAKKDLQKNNISSDMENINFINNVSTLKNTQGTSKMVSDKYINVDNNYNNLVSNINKINNTKQTDKPAYKINNTAQETDKPSYKINNTIQTDKPSYKINDTIQTDKAAYKINNTIQTDKAAYKINNKNSNIYSNNEYTNLKTQNKHLMDLLTKNEASLSRLNNKLSMSLMKINNYELLQKSQNNSDLHITIQSEKDKITNIKNKITNTNILNNKLTKSYNKNLDNLNKNCSNGINMNDYIHKKKIPCWGCNL
jgi:hypothetical protein